MSTFLDLALVMSLLAGGALALRSLPWTDSEIERVHLAALGLLRRHSFPSRAAGGDGRARP